MAYKTELFQLMKDKHLDTIPAVRAYKFKNPISSAVKYQLNSLSKVKTGMYTIEIAENGVLYVHTTDKDVTTDSTHEECVVSRPGQLNGVYSCHIERCGELQSLLVADECVLIWPAAMTGRALE